jgi:hypothetical protein
VSQPNLTDVVGPAALPPRPPDATEVLGWTQHGPDLARRPFTGAVREVAGFTVRIEGIQRENGTCRRRVTVKAGSPETRLEPEVVRQLAAALIAAANEIEARR